MESGHRLHVPSGAPSHTLTTLRRALPLPAMGALFLRGFVATRAGTFNESFMRSPALLSKDSASQLPALTARPQIEPSPRTQPDPQLSAPTPNFDVSAYCAQFVAAPGQTVILKSTLPATIRESLGTLPGLAGCMVMISDQEVRLVTLVTFWTGKERAHHCSENASFVKTLAYPFVDRRLRSDTQLAHFSLLYPPERKFQKCCVSASRST